MALDTSLDTVENFPTRPTNSTDSSTRQSVNKPKQAVLSAGARAGLTSGLLVNIVLIHLIDQDWFSFAKDPSYVQTGYTMIEIVGLIAAGMLLVRRDWWLWLASFGLGAGPLLGFIVSRSVGLPHYRDDIGNWTEPLGVASVIVECAVMLFAAQSLLAAWRQRRL